MHLVGMGLAVAFLTAAAGAVATRGIADDAPDPAAMVEAAATRADHAALAAHFEKEAVIARAKAAQHSRMAASYEKLGGALVEKLHLDRHCRSLAKAARRTAEENDALAKAHRSIAESLK